MGVASQNVKSPIIFHTTPACRLLATTQIAGPDQPLGFHVPLCGGDQCAEVAEFSGRHDGDVFHPPAKPGGILDDN